MELMRKLSCIGNYPLRECGIATFTRDLIDSLQLNAQINNINFDVEIISLNPPDKNFSYPGFVKYSINQELQEEYLNAADYINKRHADICLVQHEFGIYGGNSGIYVLPLIYRINIPIVVVLHTVLKTPNYHEKEIIKKIGGRAEKVIVMSRHAIQLLLEIYDIPLRKIQIFEHGVPDFSVIDKKQVRKKLHLDNRKILLTFGLLSRNKGIETVLYALSRIVKKHPEILYIVLGKTHPNVLRETGEEYRNSLIEMVNELDLKNNVLFIKKFMSQKELIEYLSIIDIYITPFLNKAQITSGTLSYAVGYGAAIISTPYWHAQELLADGRGRFFDFNDSQQLADILDELLEYPYKLKELSDKTQAFGRNLTWSKVGSQYLNLFNEIITNEHSIYTKINSQNYFSKLPTISLAHIYRLSDQTGILQHAKSFVPNLKEGYCLDDNARALLMITMYYNLTKEKHTFELMTVFLSFIHYMQRQDGTFRNFLSYEKEFNDTTSSEDVFGRTIWALGYLMRYNPHESLFQVAKEIFFKAVPNFKKMNSERCIATTIIGICHYLHRYRNDEKMIKYLSDLTEILVRKYNNNISKDWYWFEDILTYDNGILPLSLFYAYEILGNDKIIQIAKETEDFLDRIVFRNKYLNLIGSNGWYKKGCECAKYAQQPVDAMALVLMYKKAYRTTKNKIFYKKMMKSFLWFLGENELHISLYDVETNGCCDGLESYGVNRNQGAESILAFLISYIAILDEKRNIEKRKQNAFSKQIYEKSDFNL